MDYYNKLYSIDTIDAGTDSIRRYICWMIDAIDYMLNCEPKDNREFLWEYRKVLEGCLDNLINWKNCFIGMYYDKGLEL